MKQKQSLRVSPAALRGPSSAGAALVSGAHVGGQGSVLRTGLFSEGNTLPFPGSRKALKAWAAWKPGWWESSRQGPGSSLDKHSRGRCFRCPCRTAPPRLLRGTKQPGVSPQGFPPHILLERCGGVGLKRSAEGTSQADKSRGRENALQIIYFYPGFPCIKEHEE